MKLFTYKLSDDSDTKKKAKQNNLTKQNKVETASSK